MFVCAGIVHHEPIGSTGQSGYEPHRKRLSRPSHGMRVGADDLRLVSRNVGSVADNVGRYVAPVSVNWAGIRDDLAPRLRSSRFATSRVRLDIRPSIKTMQIAIEQEAPYLQLLSQRALGAEFSQHNRSVRGVLPPQLLKPRRIAWLRL